MKSDMAKVLHRAAGRSLLDWCLAAIAGVDDIVVVVGHQAAAVAASLPGDVRSVVQEPQHGTGHAAEVGLTALDLDGSEQILVMPGDMPLVTSETIDGLLFAHAGAGAAATVLTSIVDDPGGYGRIVRAQDGSVAAIVEDRDATDEQRSITEINTSIYVFSAAALSGGLREIDTDNAQNERYLTDVIGVLAGRGEKIHAVRVEADEALGVNTHVELAAAAAALRDRINQHWMLEGVRMEDPGRVYLDATVDLSPGAALKPDVHLEAGTVVGEGAVVGPGVFASQSDIGPGSRVMFSVLTQAIVGEGATVGPYAHLRPGTSLGDGAKVGSFVEVKQAALGDGAKVPHLSYVGDAAVGAGANVGAGTITVNYDGFQKHRTVIGERARIGSATMLVAPVEVGDDAYTGAGSVITRDVPPGSLAVARSPQRGYPGYAARRRHRAERESS